MSRAYRDVAGVPLAMFTAAHDAVGNRTGFDELGGSFAYAYDAGRQLVAEHHTGTSAYSCTFSYDGVGNRLTSTAADGAVTSYAYNPAHELLTTQALGAAPTSFSYDAAGNTVREVGPSADVTYTWDGENRLTQVNNAGSMETYTYDASGLRRRMQACGATTNYVWDRVNLLSELDGNLARIAQYTDFPGVWGGLSSQRRNGTSRHFVHDLSANTRALLDGGAVTDSYLYRAFGVEEAVSGSTVNGLRFGGQVGYYRDLADRLYVRARHYRAGVGRWVSRDPLGFAPQAERLAGNLANLYLYGGAQVPGVLDPSGMRWVQGWCWRWFPPWPRRCWKWQPDPTPKPAPPVAPIRPAPPAPTPGPISPGPPPDAGPGAVGDLIWSIWVSCQPMKVEDPGNPHNCCSALAQALADLDALEKSPRHDECESACISVFYSCMDRPDYMQCLLQNTVADCYGCDKKQAGMTAANTIANVLQHLRF